MYLGFDPLLAPKNVSTAMMYLYSAGRLIEKKKDPRKLLDVAYTGSTFLSGLTIIIDDRNTGKERYFQPNPTKENIQELEKKLSKIQDISTFTKCTTIITITFSNRIRLLSKNLEKLL